MKLYCPKCKQFVVKVTFGVACACTILTGHAEEKFPRKFSLDGTERVRMEASSSTATAVPTVAGWGEISEWMKKTRNGK
jgi:hypothetical protein